MTESGRHVAMTAPGDLVAPDGAITAGPHHAVPPCRHFPECGGCQLQHLDDHAYGQFVSDKILSAFRGQGVDVPDLLAPHISPPFSRRRAALSAQKRGNQLLLGFMAQASHRIVDMQECHILRPELFTLVRPLRALLASLLPQRRNATVRMTLCDQGVDLLIEGAAAEDLKTVEALIAFCQDHHLARLALDDGLGPQTQWEPAPVTISLGGHPVALPHASFLQASAEGEEVLVASVREAVGRARIVADLFAGLGTFALALEGRIFAAESSGDAALALKAAANRAQRQIFVERRDLFQRPLDIGELSRFEATVLDPPRAGAAEQCAQLARSTMPRIAYVSCSPESLARDAKKLIEGGYRLDWVKPVGQFRWSTHVELVAAFSR